MPLSPLEEKYATFNWHVIPCDGNDSARFSTLSRGPRP